MEAKPTPNVLTGREGEPFDLDVCANWTQNYRDRNPGDIVSHFFGREIIEKYWHSRVAWVFAFIMLMINRLTAGSALWWQ